jgi:hypothetical protein
MTTNTQQFDGDGTQAFSDETIRRFLLGELGAPEQPLFEQRLITDDGLDARIRLAEFDLTDDYAFGRLSAADQERFEKRFLLTSNRQQKLEVSRALRDRFLPTTATAYAARPEKKTVADRLRYLFGLDRTAWRIAFGVLILVILFGTAWLLIKEPRIARQITNRMIPRRSLPSSAPRRADHPTNTSSPEHQTTPSPMPLHDSAIESPESVVLFPTTRDLDKIPTVTLSNGEKDVLRLTLTVNDRTSAYRAEVLTIDGQTVFNVDWLQGPQFALDVPMRLLKSGKYQIRLSDARDGSKKEVASYYFLVH